MTPFWIILTLSMLAQVAYLSLVKDPRRQGYWYGYDSNEELKINCFYLGGYVVVFSLLAFGLHYWSHASENCYEIWNYKMVRVEYYEPWNELVTYTVTVDDGTDSQGHHHSHTETRTRIDYHPAAWEAVDDYGSAHTITEWDFNHWVGVWKNRTFKNMHRDYYSINGNMYFANWDSQFDHIFPHEEIKTYTNKVKASKDTVFQFKPVDKKTQDKYKVPADMKVTVPIFSYDGLAGTPEEISYLCKVNAIYGPNYKVRIMLLLFDAKKEGSPSIMEDVLGAWKGTNKNELVISLGLSDGQIKWCRVDSWMDDTTIHGLIRADILALKESGLLPVIKIAQTRVPQKWVKKNFRDFDYIQVPVSPWWAISYGLLAVLGAVSGVWFLRTQVF